MRKKLLLLFLAVLLFVMPVSAKSWRLYIQRQNRPTPPPAEHNISFDLLSRLYNVDRHHLIRMSTRGYSPDEIAILLYIYGSSGAYLTEADLVYIKQSGLSWQTVAWYYGMPPIILEDDFFVWRHTRHHRMFPPLGKREYRVRRHRGRYKEYLEVYPHQYEYEYESKHPKLEEKIRVKDNIYEYKYEDSFCEEKLKVNLITYHYEYKYKNKHTGQEIRKTGCGTPLTVEYFRVQLLKKVEYQPEFRFNFFVSINL
mgnify:CR=1 FL=1